MGLRDHSFGIIPARAGFTLHSRTTRPSIRDHPRSRGVYLKVSERAKSIRGSSPLARGLRRTSAPNNGPSGIIPARAGFTLCVVYCLCTMRDHPRSRGVYETALAEILEHQGSSPLARGLRYYYLRWRCAGGIIPARAGFTRPRLRRVRIGQDHPRSRGVYPPQARIVSTQTGSSPLARGLLVTLIFTFIRWRIIPARAGFTAEKDFRVQEE